MILVREMKRLGCIFDRRFYLIWIPSLKLKSWIESNEGVNELDDTTAENDPVNQGALKDPLEENQQEMAKFVESKYGNPMLLDKG
jgi:hypothetical protein